MRQTSSTYERFHRVRGWAPGVGGILARDFVTPPFLLERPCSKNQYRASLTPIIGDEWWRDRRGRVHDVRVIEAGRKLIQDAHAGAIIFGRLVPLPVRLAMVAALGIAPSWLSVPGLALAATNFMKQTVVPFYGVIGTGVADTTVVLNALMVFGASGVATAVRLVGNGKALDSTNFNIASIANTPSLAVRVRGQTTLKPNNTVADSVTAQSAAAGWTKFGTFSGATLTLGTLYYVSLEDGDAVNTATVNQTSTRMVSSALIDVRSSQSFEMFATNTGNGWSTVTNVSTPGEAVHKFTDGTFAGNPISTSQNPSGSQKGLKWVGGPTADIDIFGAIYDTVITAANFTSGQIWSGTNGPGGSGNVDESSFGVDNGVNIVGWATSAVTKRLSAGTDYRVNAKRSASSAQGSRQLQIGSLNNSTAGDLRACLPYAGNWSWTDGTSGSWSDDADSFPSLLLLLNDQVAQAAATGGMSSPVVGGINAV